MRLPLNLQISKVHLFSRKKQTIIATLGVTFGIAMFILMISFMKGVNQVLEDIMLSVTPDIRIYNDFKTDYSVSVAAHYFRTTESDLIVVHHPRPKQININLKNGYGIIDDIRRDKDAIAVSPLLSAQLLFNYGPVQLGTIVDGVDISEEDKIFTLKDKMVSGQPEDLLKTDNGLLIGYKLAEKLNLSMGDLVTATGPSGSQMRFRVAGIYKFGIAMMDEYKAYVNLGSMQQLLGKNPNYITDIRVKLKNNKDAKFIATRYVRKYGYKSDDWETVNASIAAGNLIRDTLTWVVSITLLIVAGFGIYNIMNMVIISKMKDIAILKAQGFERADIVKIFLFQSLAIGIAGGMIGLGMGFALSFALSKVPFPTDEWILIEHYPVAFEVKYYFFGALFGILTTLIAGILPAVKASQTDPVSILRG